MNTRKIQRWMTVGIALVLAGCASGYRVGELRTESESVEVGDAEAVRVDIEMGAGNLEVAGGAEGLMEADFTYNVAKLKPSVEYSDGTLSVHQPDARGVPAFEGISDFRNEWTLRLNDGVPMALSVTLGGGTSNLRLAGMALTSLHIDQGAGISTIDLVGDWAGDLDASIETGAADVTVRLPSDIGVRVEVESGPTAVSAPGFSRDGGVYTNAAYGESGVALRINMQSGIGVINLELE